MKRLEIEMFAQVQRVLSVRSLKSTAKRKESRSGCRQQTTLAQIQAAGVVNLLNGVRPYVPLYLVRHVQQAWGCPLMEVPREASKCLGPYGSIHQA